MTIAKLWFWSCVAAAIFLCGIVVGKYELFPYPALKFAQDTVQQLYSERTNLMGTRPIHFLNQARHEGSGVTRAETSQATPGYTLVSGFFTDTTELRLLALDGSVVRRWPVPIFDIHPNLDHVQPENRRPATNWNADIHGALALPDGSVVFNFEYLGLAKLDRCGEVLWTVPRMTHHSVDQSADGGFWVPSRHFRETDSEFPPIAAPYWEDTLLKVSADGEIQNEISVPQLLRKNGLLALLLANGGPELLNGFGDLGHLNDIEELPERLATQFPDFSPGDLLLSLRNLNLLLVIDPRTEIIKWHYTGPWLRQHDPDFQADGTISVFNNNVANANQRIPVGGSNIIAIDPSGGSDSTTILYEPSATESFYTHIRGKHQILGTGNILMTEFTAGRILEVNDVGEPVWEFINRYDEESIAELSHAIRYPSEHFNVDNWECE